MTRSRKLEPLDEDWLDEPSNSLSFKRLLSSQEDERLSATLVKIDGKHQELRTDASSRLYLILEGEFEFFIRVGERTPSENDAKKTIHARSGDCVLIEKGEWYSFAARGRYIVINGPAFAPGDDQYS